MIKYWLKYSANTLCTVITGPREVLQMQIYTYILPNKGGDGN